MGIIIMPNEAVGRVNKIIHGKYLAQFLAHSKRSNHVPNTQGKYCVFQLRREVLGG